MSPYKAKLEVDGAEAENAKNFALPAFMLPLVAKFVPSNVSADPLVATLLALRYNTPLAVPPFSVRLPDNVAVPALAEAIDAPVAVKPVMVAVVSSATPALTDAIEALVAVRLVITATPALMEAIEAAVN